MESKQQQHATLVQQNNERVDAVKRITAGKFQGSAFLVHFPQLYHRMNHDDNCTMQ